MGTYVYKTLAKHVKTELGNVHEAKYVTKVGCREVFGRPGKTGEHLYAYGLEELETVYLNPGHGGGFWHDSNDHKVVGYLRKNGRSWYVSLVEPTKGEWVNREISAGHVQHESSSSYEFKAQRNQNMSYSVFMLINTDGSTRKISHVSAHPHTIGTFIDKHLSCARHPIQGRLDDSGRVAA